MNRVTVAFATLGCKVNQYDTAAIETALRREGCEIVPFDAAADVYVVNTCTVTDRADAESRQLARRARRRNAAARVILTGCFAQTSPAAAASLPEVDYVIGIGRLPDIVRAVRDQPRGVSEGEERASVARIQVDDLRREGRVATLGAESFQGQTRAFLKVQEGCDLFCTFCIVPFSRGKSRSVEPRRVVEELRRLADAGFREVVLTGIHLGGYGADLRPRVSFAELIEMIAEIAPVPRLRLSSIDPPEVSERLLDVMARSDVLCPHLHMPVQAVSDPVLRRMRRQYDAARVRDVAAEIRRRLPDASLGTDVIAGFPGESEESFAETERSLAELPFTYFHVFPYSKRTGTTAAKARDPLDAPVIARRARDLRRLGAEKRSEFARRFVGRDARVLVESKRDRETGLLSGYSRNYLRVLFPGGDDLVGSEVTVRAAACEGDRLLAETSRG